MNDFCEHVRGRLLDSESGGLNAQEALHAASCPQCREVRREASEAGRMLSLAAREAQRPGAGAAPARLKERVRRRAMEKLDETTERGPSLEPRPRLPWRRLFAASPRWVQLGAAAAFALLLAGVALTWRSTHGPVGQLDFANGPVQVRRGSFSTSRQGVQALAIDRDSLLSTSPSSEALVRLGMAGETRVALGRATTLEVRSSREVYLRHGSVWVGVQPEGKGFRLGTPFGEVRVTGTIFGVTVGAEEVRVEVARGTIDFIQDGNRAEVAEAEELRARGEGLLSPTPRSEGRSSPAWVQDLRTEEAEAAKAAYLPSISAPRAERNADR